MANAGPAIRQPIIFFDWDDTLFFTQFLNTPHGLELEHSRSQKTQNILMYISLMAQNPQYTQDRRMLDNLILEFDELLFRLLSNIMRFGRIFIVTNALNGWIQGLAMFYLPKSWQLLQHLPLISARSNYESAQYPASDANYIEWKKFTFANILLTIMDVHDFNIVSVGDSSHEFQAMKSIARSVPNYNMKLVKFKKFPTIQQLYEELSVFENRFPEILFQPVSKDYDIDQLIAEQTVQAAIDMASMAKSGVARPIPIRHEGVLPTKLEVSPDSGRNSESKIQNFLPHVASAASADKSVSDAEAAAHQGERPQLSEVVVAHPQSERPQLSEVVVAQPGSSAFSKYSKSGGYLNNWFHNVY
jgi:hypothetical protein